MSDSKSLIRFQEAGDSPLHMSSQEIADLVESRHDSVKRTVERLAERGAIQLPPMVEVENSKRQTVSVYQLCKRDSYVVVAQLSPEFTARLVDRWQELEAGAPAALPNLRDPKQLAAVAVQLLAVNQELQAQWNAAVPKIEALNRIALADGSLSITDAAKTLQVQPKQLFGWLSENQWIYRRPGGSGWIGYQSRVQSGMLEHKVNTVERSDGSEKVVEQCRITPRGLTKLAEIMKKEVAHG